ncbi:hypothetical protein B0H13DRAFT_2342502 [Mycena leptocephala]|nr:hypothetical protein B0H13DRAFT_2342502 [Mycena leptocephala]
MPKPNGGETAAIMQIFSGWARGPGCGSWEPLYCLGAASHVVPGGSSHAGSLPMDGHLSAGGEFHSRVDWRLEDHEEPELKPYDPKELVELAQLSDDEEILKRQRVKLLNGRIRRWFTYRIRRRRNLASGLDPRKDPFAILLTKLTGLTAPPKARQAYQQFMQESYADKIAPVVSERWVAARENNEPGTAGRKEPKAGFRANVAREVFGALPVDEKAAIAQRAKDEAASAKATYKAALKSPPSNKPEDRQRCIDALPDLLEPILRGIQECTGLHSMVIVGGPIPKFGGDLRTVHISVGRNKAAAPVHCTQWEKDRFKQHVVKYMVDYLGTAFSESDCTAAALPVDANLENAKYTIGDDPDGFDGELSPDPSDIDSDSDMDSDVGEDAESSRASKKRKVTESKSGKAKPGAKGKHPATLANENENETPSESPSLSRNTSPPPLPRHPRSIDDVPYEELMLDQKIACNKKRNAVLAEGLKADLHALFETMPKKTKQKVPRTRKPREENVLPSRRSRRLTRDGRDDVADDEGGEDVDTGKEDAESMVPMDADDTSASAVPTSPHASRAPSILGGDVSSRASDVMDVDSEDFDTMDFDDKDEDDGGEISRMGEDDSGGARATGTTSIAPSPIVAPPHDSPPAPAKDPDTAAPPPPDTRFAPAPPLDATPGTAAPAPLLSH